jgi:long-chain acyl-CoA synthetase
MESAQMLSYANDRHLGALFFHRVDQLGDRTCLKLQRGQCFEEISWRDFGAMVQNILLSLNTVGLAPGDTVAIVGENCLQWLCADLATLSAGLPNVIVSPALSDAMLLKILHQSNCRAAFVQNHTGVGRLLNLKGQLPTLSHIIVMEGTDANLRDTLSFDHLMERGCRVERQYLYEIVESVHANDLATIMYTSGSTGEPKGVMRTQGYLVANISNGGEIVLSKPDELFIVVLSLNHLFGRFGFLKSVATGRTTAIIEATELELNLKVVASLSGTAMAVVPRVMERIWNDILNESDNWELWEQLEALDIEKAEQGNLSEAQGRQFEELRIALRNRVRQALGGRMKYISYGAAAMPPRIMRFFELVDIPLIGSYGSTECGGVTLCGVDENRPGKLGKPFPNVEVRIADDGEILVRGPTVTPGYFKNPEATGEVLEPDGWFHTGDLGGLDPDGSLRIIGRKEDIFNCADGSNIYPGYIELLLESDPFVRQAVLLGDRRPFIAVLLVPDRRKIAAAMKRQDSELTDGDVEAALRSRVAQINAKLERYEQVRTLVVFKEDFPQEVRSVNVLQKVKINRRAVEERYAREIAQIYRSETEKRGAA